MSSIYKSTHTGQEIDNAVSKVETLVSVEANPSTVGQTNLENLKVGDTVYKIPEQITPTVVKANPSADATTDLTKLQVGTTVYGIPEGGTDVVANPSTVGETNLENLKVGDTVYKIPEQITPTVVKANPSADATTDLTKLQVGTTVYGIPEGGGTEVVANPTETGTTDLTSLKVDGTVYNIPSGGSTEDALAGTWVLNDTLNMADSAGSYELSGSYLTYNNEQSYFLMPIVRVSLNEYSDSPFSVEGESYFHSNRYYSNGNIRVNYYDSGDEEFISADSSASNYTQLKTIEITSKLSEVTNGDTLLTWLQANATKQESGGETSRGYTVSLNVYSVLLTSNGVHIKSNGNIEQYENVLCIFSTEKVTSAMFTDVVYIGELTNSTSGAYKYLYIPTSNNAAISWSGGN